MNQHTDTHCHCGAGRKGSDHCPECGCEEFEGMCDHTHRAWTDERDMDDSPVWMSSEEGSAFASGWNAAVRAFRDTQ